MTEENSKDSSKEKWVEITAWAMLFADGRCTDWDSKSITREQVEALGPNSCIIEFKPYYYNNVYLLDFDDQTVTLKVGDKTATLHCGEELSRTEPLDYAYAETSVRPYSQSQLDALKKKQQEEERKKKEKEECCNRPFDPEDFDWTDEDDEFKRRRYVTALLNSMEKATDDEQWAQAQAKAWEMRKVFRGYEALKAANICFYPKYGHVDLDCAAQWYLFAQERFQGVSAKYDQTTEDKYLINENLARIYYIKGLAEEADKYVELGLERDHNPGIDAWRLNYQVLTKVDYPKAEIEKLQRQENVPALCMYLRLVAPTSDKEYEESTPEKWERIHSICQTLKQISEREPDNYSTYGYPAMLRYLEVENNVFWEEEISDRLVEGVAANNVECCYYNGIISWYAADLVREVNKNGEEDYDEIMEKLVLKAFRKAADQADAMSCYFYAMALEKVKPDSPEIAKYRKFWQRLTLEEA